MTSSDTAERWNALFTSCGQVIILFARLESYLSACLRFNLSWRVDTTRYTNARAYAAAVYGSQRFKASKDTIKRIVEHEGKLSAAQRRALSGVLEHAAHIANLRDKLAHQFAIPHPDDRTAWLITDNFSTRRLDDHQTWQISTPAIARASADLSAAISWMGNHAQSGTLFKRVPDEQPTWRYKPSELELLNPEIASALRERARPPLSSEA